MFQNSRTRTIIACAALSMSVVVAQQTAPQPDNLPPARGVYHQTPSGWVALPATVLMPFTQPGVRDYLVLGGRRATAEMPGPRAVIQSSSARPIFYVRGFSPGAPVYLVRGNAKPDHRELRMRVNRRIADGPEFLDSDLRDVEVQAVGPDLHLVRPRSDLPPGEYALVSVLDRSHRWIHIGFEFGVSGSGN